MKNLRVEVQPEAQLDLEDAFLYAAHRAPETAARWLRRFEEHLKTLRLHPERCGFAPENGKVKRELRQLLFGRKPHVYRIIFTMDGDIVRVLRIRRAARRPFKKKDLE